MIKLHGAIIKRLYRVHHHRWRLHFLKLLPHLAKYGVDKKHLHLMVNEVFSHSVLITGPNWVIWWQQRNLEESQLASQRLSGHTASEEAWNVHISFWNAHVPFDKKKKDNIKLCHDDVFSFCYATNLVQVDYQDTLTRSKPSATIFPLIRVPSRVRQYSSVEHGEKAHGMELLVARAVPAGACNVAIVTGVGSKVDDVGSKGKNLNVFGGWNQRSVLAVHKLCTVTQ